MTYKRRHLSEIYKVMVVHLIYPHSKIGKNVYFSIFVKKHLIIVHITDELINEGSTYQKQEKS